MDLDPVEQAWIADVAPYVAAMAELVDATRNARDEAVADMAEIQAAIDSIHGGDVHVSVDAEGVEESKAFLESFIDSLADADRAAGEASRGMDDYRGSLDSLAGALRDTEGAEDALKAPSEGVTQALLDQTSELGRADEAVQTVSHHYGLFGMVMSALTAKVPLFGGALSSIPLMGEVAGWHLLADAIVETTAVWVPAAIAFTAFGAAALPTVQDIYTQMKNLNTVSEATGQQIPGLTGDFGRLSEAVRPEVYDLFGEALQTITHNGGAFSTMAEGAGQVLDQLGARMEVAVTDGHGLSGFATTAVTDLGKLTNSIGNVVGIFGDFLKVVPGYAGILLGLGDSATHVAEDFTTVAEPVLKAGLALHGAIIYGGLAATAVAAAMRGGLTMIGNWGEKAAMAAADSDMLGGALSKAAPAMFSFSAGAAEAAALPWGWITIAAAGFAVLAYEMLTTKDATTQWLDAQQSALGEASAGVKGFTQLQEDQAQVTTRLAVTTQHYGLTVAQANHAVNDMGGSFQVTARAIQGGAKSISELSTGQKILSDQTTLYEGRLGKLGATYGSVGAAQGLLAASGIKMSQMLDKSSEAWAEIQAQVGGLVAAYREMGQQGGTLGADMNALTIAGSNQVSAMSNLNKAWDNTIAITSGGQNAFISFQQALSSSAVGSAKLDSSIGSLSIAMKASGASMTGLNAPSLALRSAWQGAYGAGEQLTDALRMMSSVSPGGFPSITKAMKDTIAEMMPLGKQSGATRAELVQMAQEIDPNIHNFQQLTQWLGNTKNAGQDLNKILTQAGTNLDDLAAAASKLSNAMQSDVTAQMAQAKLAANGTDTAISDLATAMNTAGTSAATQHGDMVKLYDDLRQDGYGAQQAQAMIESMTGAIFKIPHGEHTTFTNNAQSAEGAINSYLHYLDSIPARVETEVVTNFVSTGYSGPGGTGHRVGAHGGLVSDAGIIPSFAGGGALPGFAPGVDSILAALSPGEGVLTPYAMRMIGGSPALNWLNSMAEHGSSAGGGAQGAPAAGAGQMAENHVHVYLDGKEIHSSVQAASYRWQTRNGGARTGLSIPGRKIG